jgi:hypothetical protein
MNVQSGIPLRADSNALRAAERRSFVRAATAIFLGGQREHGKTDRILRSMDDPLAIKIVKAASRPTESDDLSALHLQSIAILPLLAPAAASVRLLALATSIDMTGVVTISVPHIGTPPGLPPVPFIAEGQPAPVVALNLGVATLGPTKKLLIIAALSREVQEGSAGAAEVVIGQALATATEQSMDAALFSDAPADDTRPAGLLYGVTPIDASSTPTAAEGVAQTLGLLADEIGAAGINADDIVIITTPKLATKIRVLASPKFANLVLSSSSVADGTVIGIVPRGLITGYSGGVKIEVSSHATLHMEDAAPADIGMAGTPPVVAFPTKGTFQTELVALRVRGWAAWTVHTGAIAVAAGVTW